MSNENAPSVPSNRARALATVDAVRVYDEQLGEIYAKGLSRPAEVKALNSRIGVGLKLAEIHALLAIGDAVSSGAIERLRGQLLPSSAERGREIQRDLDAHNRAGGRA